MMPTHVHARAHRDTGVLVRGVDEYNNVDIDPSPKEEFGAAELAAWQRATQKTGKNVFDGSPLPLTEVYGGQSRSCVSCDFRWVRLNSLLAAELWCRFKKRCRIYRWF